MPTEIDYSKRGIWENIFDPGAWQNLVGGVSTITTGVADVFEQMERVEGSKGLTPTIEPARIERNLTWRDFKFTPNVKLIIFGGALLLVALVLSRRK